MKNDNIVILGRKFGAIAHLGTPETDADEANPNFIPPKDGIEALVATLEDMGFAQPRYVAMAISERLTRHGYGVAAREKIKC